MNGIAVESIAEHPDFVPLRQLQGIAVDLRYASPNNFVGRDVYVGLDCAWLRREAASGLESARDFLRAHQPQWTLVVFDALRPQRIQEALYLALEGTPLVRYLAHPERGSIHSFGMAVDVGLLDASGQELDMGAGFDEMDAVSHPEYEAEMLAQGRLNALVARRHASSRFSRHQHRVVAL
jgi:zinc D-Ala-D-Ala dipeptidase